MHALLLHVFYCDAINYIECLYQAGFTQHPLAEELFVPNPALQKKSLMLIFNGPFFSIFTVVKKSKL